MLDIRLHNRLSNKNELTGLANQIRSREGAGCSPLFIFYFLPGKEPGKDIAWAYSHFNPELKIGFNGLDLDTENKLASTAEATDRNIIGSWLATGPLPHLLVIKNMNGSYKMIRIFDGGSTSTENLTVKIVKGVRRFYIEPANEGEYVIIEKNGILSFYDNQGYIESINAK